MQPLNNNNNNNINNSDNNIPLKKRVFINLCEDEPSTLDFDEVMAMNVEQKDTTKETTQKTKKQNKIIRENTETTLSTKYIEPKAFKRNATKVSYTETKSTTKTENLVKKHLDKAYDKQDNHEFEKAAKYYNSALSKNAYYFISKERYNTARKEVFICEMKIWKNSANDKLNCLRKAISSLESYLNLSIPAPQKKAALDLFAVEINAYAIEEMENAPFLGFCHLSELLAIDFAHENLIDKDVFHKIIDDIIYNMSVCIDSQKSGDLDQLDAMVGEMHNFVNYSPITQESKDKYLDFLRKVVEEGIKRLDEEIKQDSESSEGSIREQFEISDLEDSSDWEQYVKDIEEDMIPENQSDIVEAQIVESNEMNVEAPTPCDRVSPLYRFSPRNKMSNYDLFYYKK